MTQFVSLLAILGFFGFLAVALVLGGGYAIAFLVVGELFLLWFIVDRWRSLGRERERH